MVAAVDVQRLVVHLRFELFPETVFFSGGECLPVLIGQFSDLHGREVLILLGVLEIPLLDEPAVGREYLALVREQLVFDIERVPLSPPDLVHLEVVILLLCCQFLPLL